MRFGVCRRPWHILTECARVRFCSEFLFACNATARSQGTATARLPTNPSARDRTEQRATSRGTPRSAFSSESSKPLARQPRSFLQVSGNFFRHLGIHEKQSSCFFQARTLASVPLPQLAVDISRPHRPRRLSLRSTETSASTCQGPVSISSSCLDWEGCMRRGRC